MLQTLGSMFEYSKMTRKECMCLWFVREIQSAQSSAVPLHLATIVCTDLKQQIHTILQNKRMRWCRVPPPPPPPIIFERLKLPQQIIYRRKGNLSESPNHLKYWENILISRSYEHFSRNSRNLGHFWKFEKISNS